MTLKQIEARAKILFDHAAANRDRLPQLLSDGAAWLAAGAPLVSPETLAERKRVCESCDHWRPIAGSSDTMHCAACKCLAMKLAFATSLCPLNKWAA